MNIFQRARLSDPAISEWSGEQRRGTLRKEPRGAALVPEV